MVPRARFRSVLPGPCGFSMIEMLLAAVIMGVGILGLSTLMAMSLKANTSSRSLTTAVQLAERTLDEAEFEGRNSLISARAVPAVAPVFPANNYFAAPVNRNYDAKGVVTTAADFYFAVGTVPTVVQVPVTALGGLADIRVAVLWTEGVNASNQPLQRQVVITRRVRYATL